MTDAPAGRSRSDEGSILLLVAGFVAVALLLVAVVTDASTLFLARRALTATADGAASHAAQAIAVAGLYQQAPGDPVLPIDPGAARRAVLDYLVTTSADQPGLRVLEVATNGRTVTVILGATAVLPFTALISADPGGLALTAESRALTAVAP